MTKWVPVFPVSKERSLGTPDGVKFGMVYQTRQEFAGNIGCPLVHPKALPNPSKFLTVPLTRQRPGE
jgi:hypothetical protein